MRTLFPFKPFSFTKFICNLCKSGWSCFRHSIINDCWIIWFSRYSISFDLTLRIYRFLFQFFNISFGSDWTNLPLFKVRPGLWIIIKLWKMVPWYDRFNFVFWWRSKTRNRTASIRTVIIAVVGLAMGIKINPFKITIYKSSSG